MALTELDADEVGQAPGRFGFDEPELALHQAEAHLTLGRTEQARALAEDSAAACTPGWAAATRRSRRRPDRGMPAVARVGAEPGEASVQRGSVALMTHEFRAAVASANA
ncbi:hypothetical protein GCM10010307_81770 [Streptomyces vastus]|uniref:Tetratricopeptide repeat protein n=1 Tax=Streptomyces vastus TaxID=285451 RepID=A0ABP6EDW9_9ACTN